ncbi:MAG: hypothetical protein JWM81_220 [Candidatus Saccharibacteria bacterium]|nr:hypothetical protein [Candidatus Saccharibacteria bacterium]
MLKIDDNLLQEIGLAGLPDGEKNSLLKHIYETLEMRVGMRLADQMTNEQLDEFERYFEAKDDAGAFKWLETNFPNYKDIVQEEFDKLKSEVATAAPQILSASQQQGQIAAQQPQPQFQQPQQYAQPQPAPQYQQPQPAYQPAQPAPDANQGYQPQDAPAPAQPYAAPPQYQQPAQPQYQQPYGAPAPAPAATPQPQYQPVQDQPQPYPPQQPPAGPGAS